MFESGTISQLEIVNREKQARLLEELAEKLPPQEQEEQEKAEKTREQVGFALNFLREHVFLGSDKYAVTGSVAYFLHDNQKPDAEKNAPMPDDLDLHAFDESTFYRIIEKINNIGQDSEINNVKLGKIEKIPGENTRRIAGVIEFNINEDIFPFKFELFYSPKGSEIVDQTTREMTMIDPTSKLKILTEKGLIRQYGANIKREQRIDIAVREIVRYLMHPGILKKVMRSMDSDNNFIKTTAKRFDVSADQLIEVYRLIIDGFAATKNYNHITLMGIQSKLAKILGPHQTKTAARAEKIANLQSENQKEIEDLKIAAA